MPPCLVLPTPSLFPELEDVCDRLSISLNLGTGVLKLGFSNVYGYHLTLPTDRFEQIETSDRRQFRVLTHKGKRTICTTDQVSWLESRQAESYKEIATLTRESARTSAHRACV